MAGRQKTQKQKEQKEEEEHGKLHHLVRQRCMDRELLTTSGAVFSVSGYVTA
jgi:hypothetical protein